MTSVQVCWHKNLLCNGEAKFLDKLYLKDIVLTTKQLDGEEVIPLKFVKFQNVQVLFPPFTMTSMIKCFPQNIQLFLSDNQGGEDVTQVHIEIMKQISYLERM